MSVFKRLIISFSVSIIIAVFIGGAGFWGILHTTQTFENLLDREIALITSVRQLKIEALQHRRFEKDFFLNIGKPEKQKTYLEKFEAVSARLKTRIIAVGELCRQAYPQERELLTGIESSRSAYLAYVENFRDLARTILAQPDITPQQANKLMEPFKDKIYVFENGIDDIETFSQEKQESVTSQAIASAGKLKTVLVSGMTAGILFICLAVFFTIRNLSATLRQLMAGLGTVSSALSSAAEQVYGGSQATAQGASEQAAAVEETSASMEEMAAMTTRNAHSAGEADQLMEKTIADVQQAGSSTALLSSSMDDIADASQETRKIIKTIDDIAFQTNLLALNAAVEAARAGESGAGFAVVADEVRQLAVRAAEAAKQTGQLLTTTLEKVETGTKQVTSVNDIFDAIRQSAEEMSALISDISDSTKEQSQGIEQISTAVTELDRVIQTNAAGAEESAGAATELKAQAGELRLLMDRTTKIILGQDAQARIPETMVPADLTSHGLVSHKSLSLLPDRHSRNRD